MKNGETIKFVSMRQLKKYYEEKKDLVNTYIKEKDIEFNNPDDILELIKYMEGS
jgi:CO dehydrogenase/acetyl-CoA synthase alpha subunit